MGAQGRLLRHLYITSEISLAYELLDLVLEAEEHNRGWLRSGIGQEVELEFPCYLVEGRNRKRLQLVVSYWGRTSKGYGECPTHQRNRCAIQGHMGSKGSYVLCRVRAAVIGF
ncbi:hypothetical protein BHE74_00015967 [Ensete ventricosum]|nr:hypothetical protein BHE74_00015967 [Ensete ventricosum]